MFADRPEVVEQFLEIMKRFSSAREQEREGPDGQVRPVFKQPQFFPHHLHTFAQSLTLSTSPLTHTTLFFTPLTALSCNSALLGTTTLPPPR